MILFIEKEVKAGLDRAPRRGRSAGSGEGESEGYHPQKRPEPADHTEAPADQKSDRNRGHRGNWSDPAPRFAKPFQAAHGLRQLLQLQLGQTAAQADAVTHLHPTKFNLAQVSVRIHARSVLSSRRLAANGFSWDARWRRKPIRMAANAPAYRSVKPPSAASRALSQKR